MANTTNWLNISAQSGSSGETILTLSAQRNLSTDYKYAEITAYNPVYNISAKTYVSLASYQPFINVAPAIVGVPETGGTYELSITANCAYVIAYPDLVTSYSTSAATGNTTITFSVSGTYEETTLVGNIVITDESGQVSRTVRVEQYGGGAELVYAPGVIYIDSTGGNAYFAVSANCPYTITKLNDPDWFSVSPTSGYTGRTEFVVTAGENTGSTDVTGYISINGPGSTGGVVEVIHKKAETRLVVYYNVTSTSNPTQIFSSSTAFSKAELGNGTEIPLSATGYTFATTGRQAVYYTLTGTSIGQYSFDSCYKIVEIRIPTGVTTIGSMAFDNTNLSALTLPDSVTSIGDNSFSFTRISSLHLGTGLTTIGPYAFWYVTGLTSVEIPSSVTSIGTEAFADSTASKFYFTSPTPATLGTSALNSTNLTEIIVPCTYYNAYVTAWPQYEQYMTCQDTELYFVTDTSNVKGIGETRTITILNTNINENRTGLDLPGDFPAVGSYTVSGNKIYLKYPANPSSSSTRTWRIGVVAQTNDGVSLKGYYTITQNALQTVPIPYTADTSTVNKTGETRTITIDTSGLVESSITISVVGATGVTTTYNNGVITVVFPENYREERNITVTINGQTTNGNSAVATIQYIQEGAVYVSDYFTIVAKSTGNIVWPYNTDSTASANTIEYSINNGNWIAIMSDSSNTIAVSSGDRVRFRGDNNSYAYKSFQQTDCQFDVEGNIMSLINSTNFSAITQLETAATFIDLFRGCTGLTNANKLILPATTLTNSCYQSMFQGCTSLTTAPELPATTLANRCYEGMFDGCTSLTTAPSLPATTLATSCYTSMFNSCGSLTTVPVLSATTLSKGCYWGMFGGCSGLTNLQNYSVGTSALTMAESACRGMFAGCTSLTTAPALPATTLASDCYWGMFAGCTSLVTAPALPATTLASGCCYQMFLNCTSLTSSPVLPSLLAGACFQEMFAGCTSLTTAPALPATSLTISCYSTMFKGCTGLTTAPVLSAVTLAANCYEHMFEDCSSLAIAPALPATTLADYCYRSMFDGCTSLTTAPVLSASTMTSSCYASMFAGCTSLTTAPELPATTLANNCYSYMFSGCTGLTTPPTSIGNSAITMPTSACSSMFANCTSLTTAPSIPAQTLSKQCYWSMFYGCTSLTTAPELPATTLAESCYQTMFYNCTGLNYVKCLATTNVTSTNTRSWLNGVSSSGTFVTPSSTNWTTGTSGIPTGWTRVNA